jgi:preprotein translocase subunit SecD
VLLALVFGVVFAIPNLFAEDPAIQVASRSYEAISPAQQQSIEVAVREAGVAHSDSFISDGRLMLRFDNVPDQLKARDALTTEAMAQYIVALTRTTRMPQLMRRMGFRPMSLGLDLRGGLYLLYQVDVEGAVFSCSSGRAGIPQVAQGRRIPYVRVERAASSARPYAIPRT